MAENNDWESDSEDPVQELPHGANQQQGLGFGVGRQGFGGVGLGRARYQRAAAFDRRGFGSGVGFGHRRFEGAGASWSERFGTNQLADHGFGQAPAAAHNLEEIHENSIRTSEYMAWIPQRHGRKSGQRKSLYKKQNALKSKSSLIKKTQVLADEISRLHINQEMSDVVFVVDGQRFPAHKFLLSIRSNYFKTMFLMGVQKSDDQEVTLMDTSVEPFSHILRYLYTGQMHLEAENYQLSSEVFALACKYELPVLQEQIGEYLQAILSIENISIIYATALLYSFQPLLESCVAFLDTNKHATVISEPFLNFSLNLVEAMVQKVNWSGSEEFIMSALKRWIIANNERIEDIRPIIKPMGLELVEIDRKLHLVKTLGSVKQKEQNSLSRQASPTCYLESRSEAKMHQCAGNNGCD